MPLTQTGLLQKLDAHYLKKTWESKKKKKCTQLSLGNKKKKLKKEEE